MKTNNKPWLDESGSLLSTEALKEISKNWDQQTWEEYLQTLEVGIEGLQIHPRKFQKKCELLKESIWEFSSETPHPDLQKAISFALSELTPKQRVVIEKYFFEGRSETQIADDIGKHRTTVHEIKKTALERVKTYLAKNPCNLTSMKGQENPAKDVLDQIEDHYWEGTLSDDEFYRLWALAEVGGLKEGDLS